MIFEHESYRTYLREVLAERARKNPSYSLRALARQLGLPASQLAETIKGVSSISVRAGRKVADRLGLPSPEAEYFCLLIQFESEKNERIRSGLLDRINQLRPSGEALRDLTVDVFRKVADWHHSAILVLIFLPGFELTATNAAKRLGITKLEAEVALDRLARLELIEKDARGHWTRSAENIRFHSEKRNAAMKSFYKQMLEKTSSALDDQEPMKERLSGYEMMPCAREALPLVNEALEECFDKVTRIARKFPATDVYHLGIHFFSLTHPREDKRPQEKP